MKEKYELPKAYEAKLVDAKWYRFWEESGFFQANANSPKKPYCISIPPPNVTGVLHMGHALVNTLQDILIRWKRMLGFEALWVPGTDHAGISTQTVVERHLIKTYGKRRTDYSRAEFLKFVWEWKEASETRILEQLKRLGCSCDWTRLRFTMDEGCSQAVRTMFHKLYSQKLIYRGDYLVNWDPVTQTALADDEVEYEDRDSFLWFFQYPLKDEPGCAIIATTRPETMLGDTAVAVSPKDKRYAHLIGKTLLLPLVDREIPIIADNLVDPEFGTGMVKVTPAHDPNDYQMGLAHKLPFVNIMTPDGKINANGGRFEGLSMEDARQAVVEEMKKLGLVEKIIPHQNRVGVSYRSKATIEPYLSKQWFVCMQDFAKRLRAIVETGETKLIPKNWENTYFHWIDNLRDWCISRQLWWGHRIPIWYNKADPEKMICQVNEEIPQEVQNAPEEWIQEEDVLDTWFSSSLWPMEILGWPKDTPDLARFYPNAVLVTGHDILFFWVARMMLMGDYAMDKTPFPETFLHGLIYGKSYWRANPKGGITYVNDEERKEYDLGKPTPKDVISKWEKMSKSKGNVIDPLEIIDEYGTDAMRMALCSSATQAREIDLDRRRFEEFRNFANKIWNGARFVFLNLEGDEKQNTSSLAPQEFSEGIDESLLSLEDHWILSALTRTVRDVNGFLEHYQFDQAALIAYDFFWKEFCANYLEIVKPVLFGKIGKPSERKNKQKLLVIVLLQAIRLLHPIAPFITEELFQQLKIRFEGAREIPQVDIFTQEAIKALENPACMVAAYPVVLREGDINPEIEETFSLVEQVVYTIRNLRGEMKLPPNAITDIQIIGQESDPHFVMLKQHQDIVKALIKTHSLQLLNEEPQGHNAAIGMLNSLKIRLPIPQEQLLQEKERLIKEKERLVINLEKLRAQIANPEFISRAPPQLVEKHKMNIEVAEKQFEEVSRKLESLR